MIYIYVMNIGYTSSRYEDFCRISPILGRTPLSPPQVARLQSRLHMLRSSGVGQAPGGVTVRFPKRRLGSTASGKKLKREGMGPYLEDHPMTCKWLITMASN